MPNYPSDRLCLRCKEVKKEQSFPRGGDGKRRNVCGACNRKANPERRKRQYWNDPERHRTRQSEFHKKNRPYYRALQRARNRGYEPVHTLKEWRELKRQYGYKCLCCGSREDITRDHVKPIKFGGTDHISNIQPLCRSCNSRKGTKEIDHRA